jgi:hypothetical protein
MTPVNAAATGAIPPVFAASPGPVNPALGDPVGLFSSRTGDLQRWLTRPPKGLTDGVLGLRDGWVYFARGTSVWRVRTTDGPARLVMAGTTDYALSPDGRSAAYVISANHGNTSEIVARNFASGQHKTFLVGNGHT